MDQRGFRDRGGLAAVICNNVSGGFFGTLGDINSSTIPATSISQEDGLALLKKVGSSATVSSIYQAPVSGYAYYDGTSMATQQYANPRKRALQL